MCVKTNQRQQDAIMLSPSVQKALVFKWLELTRQKVYKYLGSSDYSVDDLDWWRRNSCGEAPLSDLGKPRPELSEVDQLRDENVLPLSD